MAPELQTKLLRFTQDRMLSPIGGVRARHIDTRIIAATSRTTGLTESGSGGLRADLAARLGAEPIRIPPLRDRIEDMGALASYLMGNKDKPFDRAAFQSMCLYGWPGNVRELGKAVMSAEALAVGAERIGFDHLPAAIASVPRLRSSPGRRKYRKPPSAEELEIADEAVPGEHDARRARAGSQAGAGLPVGAAIRPAGGGIPAQRGRGKRRRRQRGSGRRRGRKLSRWAAPAGGGPTMWGRTHMQIHGYETETMKIGLATRHLPRCDASACDPDHGTAEVRAEVNAWMT